MTTIQDVICGTCKYDLSASPSTGKCPECGKYYNRRSGEGLATKSNPSYVAGDRLMQMVTGVSLLVLALTILSCGGFVAYLRQSPKPFWIMALVAAVVVMAAVTKLLSHRKPY